MIARNAKRINEDNTGLDFQYDIENGEFVFVKAKTHEEAAD